MKIDEKLLEDCIRCKRLAQNQLYKEVFSYLMNICIRYKNDYNTAGASLNAIFLKILTNLNQFNKKDSFVPWMKRIAVNHLIDEYRKEKREKEKIRFEDSLVSSNSSTHHEMEAEMDSEYLVKMIQQLPQTTAQVFNLYAIDGFKHREIAEMLAMSENTSKWHVSDARKKLQCMLSTYNETV